MARSSLAEVEKVTPKQLGRVLTESVHSGVPAMVWGPPGVGKSDVARQVSESLGRRYIDIRALLLDPVDLRGIPWRDESNQTRWATPVFLPSPDEDPCLINFDELPSAPMLVQTALYQLIHDRKCGEYTLADKHERMACGNRLTDGGGVHRMPLALRRRFVHYELETDIQDWMEWASTNDIETEVMFFLQHRPHLLYDEHLNKEGVHSGGPTPRTWEFASRIVKSRRVNGKKNSKRTEDDLVLYQGAVGRACAAEFIAFLGVWRSMPHPRVVLDDPHKAPIPNEPSALLALCGSLCRYVRPETMGSLVTYAKRIRIEVAEFLISQAGRINPDVQKTRAFVQWATWNANSTS